MRILILDKDTDYSKRFKHYLGKKFPHTQIIICDNPESAKVQLQDELYDIVLYDVCFGEAEAEEIEKLVNGASFAFLSETDEIVNERDTIFKYHGVSVLYSTICTVYEKSRKRVVKTQTETASTDENEKKTEIITFLPVHGGAGSSTMAAACALKLSQTDPVLYINFEQRPSDFVFFEGESKKSLTDIISAMKTKYKPEGLKAILEQAIQKDTKQQSDNLSYIRGYNNIMDCMSLQASQIDSILKMVSAYFNFKYVVIDADFIIDKTLEHLIYTSDKLVFVSAGSDISNMKLTKIRRYLDILKRDEEKEMPRNFLIFNQYYGLNDEETIARDMELVARFPRYRTGDKKRITSQQIIEQVVNTENAFENLK